MNEGHRARRTCASALVLALAVLGASGTRAAGDCFQSLAAQPGWSCHVELSTGASVDYCLELLDGSGGSPGSRSFRMNSTGPYRSSCSCRAKGEPDGAAFGEDKTYLCLDRDTDTVVHGKVSKSKHTGQTFNVSANVRSTFRCEPDPSCEVQPVIDPYLPPVGGSTTLAGNRAAFGSVTAGGEFDVGYLPGCAGYTSEAPSLVFDVDFGGDGVVGFWFDPDLNYSTTILVVSPSGETRCNSVSTVNFLAEDGPYRAWVVLPTPTLRLQRKVYGQYAVGAEL